jgi:NAD(P)-dependent dehydrogenase (short-subunit alcohol dehydrogenase family)
MRLKDKVVIITGGGSGIGSGVAKICAKEGAKVIITGRRKEKLEETKRDIENYNGSVWVYQMDVSKEEKVIKLFSDVYDKYGKIDVLYNNAGIFNTCGKKVADVSVEEFDKQMYINLRGTFLCCKYVIPYMQKGGGSIINCSSISGHIGQGNNGVYNAAKGGIEMLTKNIALDYGVDKIRCNTVCPAYVEIDFNKEQFEKNMEDIIKRHPAGRPGYPEDIGYAVVYLASDESTWVTGASFMIDGGYTCGTPSLSINE